MAIELERTAQLWGITGNLGGGKSLTAVWFAVRAIQSGYFVVSNITLREDSLRRLIGDYAVNLYQHVSLDDPDFDPFKLPCGSPRGRGGDKRVLVIFDECAEWIDQYSSAKDPRISRFWSWLRHTSKRSQDVFIIVQRPDYLNKVVRILISRWIMVADLQTYRLPVLRCRFPFMGGYVMRNVYDRSGVRIGGVSFISKSRWGVFYDTSECLNQEGAQYNSEYSRPRIKRRQPLFFVAVYLFSLVMLYNATRRLIAFSGGSLSLHKPLVCLQSFCDIIDCASAPRGLLLTYLCASAARFSLASAAPHLRFDLQLKPRGARHLGLFYYTILRTLQEELS